MRPFRLGLTGSIGMGKSTTAALFAAEGLPVWDADAAVHRLYSAGGAAVDAVAALFPTARLADAIDRQVLRSQIAADASALARLERVVHPLVAADRAEFARKTVSDIAVFDIPLLFESGTDAEMNATLLATASAAVQRQRVMARPNMTEAQFALILSRQMPDAEKRSRAVHIVETLSIDQTRAYVQALITHIRAQNA